MKAVRIKTFVHHSHNVYCHQFLSEVQKIEIECNLRHQLIHATANLFFPTSLYLLHHLPADIFCHVLNSIMNGINLIMGCAIFSVASYHTSGLPFPCHMVSPVSAVVCLFSVAILNGT
jgi:hypothetical protein